MNFLLLLASTLPTIAEFRHLVPNFLLFLLHHLFVFLRSSISSSTALFLSGFHSKFALVISVLALTALLFLLLYLLSSLTSSICCLFFYSIFPSVLASCFTFSFIAPFFFINCCPPLPSHLLPFSSFPSSPIISCYSSSIFFFHVFLYSSRSFSLFFFVVVFYFSFFFSFLFLPGFFGKFMMLFFFYFLF